MTVKKRNPNEMTFRNERALKKILVRIKARLDVLERLVKLELRARR